MGGKQRGKIQYALTERSRDEFEILVGELLRAFIPRFQRSRRMGELDCLGIDCFQHDEPSQTVTLAVQCKGFERLYSDDQLDQCVKDVRKFMRTGPVVEQYWLVVNRNVGAKHRAPIEAALEALRQSGKAPIARLFDLKAFTRHLLSLAAETIGRWAAARHQELQSDFANRLAIVRHLDGAPFLASEIIVDPQSWIVERVRDYLDGISDARTGPSRAPPRFLLTAGFGFGKTSTLHAVAAHWSATGGHALYIPAALIPGRAFGNPTVLAESLLDLIRPSDADTIPLADHILREAFVSELKQTKRWLFLLDAIDESRNWTEQSALAALWSAIIDLGLPAVVTVRQELFELRRAEFLAGDGRHPEEAFFEVLTLLDWPADLIGRFLGCYADDRLPDPPPPAFQEFQAAVQNGAYKDLYGDIPRRPLFLGMLAEDAWRNLAPERHLHRLYEHYIRRKLDRDRYAAGAFGRPVRDGVFQAELGLEEANERMLMAMQLVAVAMASGAPEDGAVIRERDMRAIFDEVMGVSARAEEVALNSLLQPAGRDPARRERLFRFAHQSFQDWFTGRWIAFGGDATALSHVSPAVRMFADRIAADREPAPG